MTGKSRKPEEQSELERFGLEVATDNIEKHGYEVVEQGWECEAGVADIIAWDRDMLVFIELRTGTNRQDVPYEKVGRAKLDRWDRVAMGYLETISEAGSSIRFDTITVVKPESGPIVMRHEVCLSMKPWPDSGEGGYRVAGKAQQ